MQAWSEKEISRFKSRNAMFIRRGMSKPDAEAFADKLAARDQEHDDLRACIECKHLQSDGGCFAAVQGWIQPANLIPHKTILQRCDVFAWAVPKAVKENA